MNGKVQAVVHYPHCLGFNKPNDDDKNGSRQQQLRNTAAQVDETNSIVT
jgi:hypothetical protein